MEHHRCTKHLFSQFSFTSFRLCDQSLFVLGLSEMSSQVCDKLSERPWQKYDTSSVPKIPGIYAIGEKKVGSKKIEYVYV